MFDGILASQAAKGAIIFAFGIIIILVFLSQSKDLDHPKSVSINPEDIVENFREQPGRMIRVGGLSSPKEKNDEIDEVINKIKPELESRTGTKYEELKVLNYKTQVVAGTNYFAKVEAKSIDGKESIMHMRIYKDLKKNLELTAYQLDQTREAEIEHFEP